MTYGLHIQRNEVNGKMHTSFIVLKTQIKIRPQPLVYDLSVVCVIWVISIEAECYIYMQDLRLCRLFANHQAPVLKQQFLPQLESMMILQSRVPWVY